ncbi:MAG TPA: PorV/PorQ family protein [bacterium]|nr:PorV/PorQ family protein [bacterium]
MSIIKKSFTRFGPSFPLFLALSTTFLVGNPSAISQQVSGAGSTSTNFQKIGMGARASAMGNSFTAVSDDSTAVFWNPAGLELAKGTQFSLTQGQWLLGVTHEFFSFSQNIDQAGAFGGSFGYLDSGSFPGALENPNGSYGGVGPNINANSFTGTVAYSQRLGNWIPGSFWKRFMAGVSATVVGQSMVNIGNAGANFNLGLMYEITRKTFYLGASLQNVGTQIQNFSQPVMGKIGGSYRLRNTLMKKDQDIISADMDIQNDTGFKVGIGDEYKMTFGRNDVFLRAGYTTVADLTGLTAGAGIGHRFDDFDAQLDYAYVPYGILGDTHRISLSVIIGGDVVKPEAYAVVSPAFILGQQTVGVNFSTRSEEPIDSYKINILDSNGMLVKSITGKGNPPSHYLWDGRNQTGELVPQGNYNFNLEVTDDNDLQASARPAQTFAKWVPKRVPYQYTFQVSGDLLFDSGKAELLQRGYDTVQKAALSIRKRYPDSVIIIAGHTDDQKLSKGAKFKDNQALSLARAQAVMDYLVKNGMDATKLSVVGYGDTKPIASNATPAGRAKNRRVELVVSGVMDATATDLIEEGMIQFKNNNFKEALDRFLKALESDSRSAKAYHLAGDCYLRLGGKAQAIQAYRMSLKYNPNDAALKQWMNENAPQPVLAPLPAAPVSNTPPASSPNSGLPALPPAQPAQPNTQAPAPSTSSGQASQSQPVAAAPAAPSTQAAPTGVPQPMEAQ